jgi:site-specific DNA-cytosine methylase
MGLKVIELFAGIGTFSHCLQSLGFKIDRHVLVENDKFCQMVLRARFPEAEIYNDVREFDGTKFQGFSICSAGSICVDLSSMNKNSTGLAGAKSGLFWHGKRIVDEAQPKHIIFENVASMRNSERLKISKALQLDSVLLDSSKLSSPQKRCRYYWSTMDIKQSTEPLPETTFQQILQNGYAREKFSKTLITNHVSLTESGIRRALGLTKFGAVGQLIYETPELAAMKPEQIVEHFKQHAGTRTKKNPLDFHGGVRNITVIEAERLQGLPDDYTNVLGNSMTQRYKQLGNGFNCAHINYILSQNIDLLNELSNGTTEQ